MSHGNWYDLSPLARNPHLSERVFTSHKGLNYLGLVRVSTPPPYDPIKAANDIQLAAFFFYKSTTYGAVTYSGVYWQLNELGG
jgi:hypothetical protein